MADEPQVSSDFSTEAVRGATIVTAYARREVKAYPVFDSELQTLSFFNGLMLAFSSVASFLLALACGIWTNAMFAASMTPEGAILSRVAAPILCGLAIVFLSLTIWAYLKRKSSWLTIQQESVSVTEVAAQGEETLSFLAKSSGLRQSADR